MNLLLLTDDDAVGDHCYRIADDRAEHVRGVLKLAEGDQIEVGLLNGPQGIARVENINSDGVTIVALQLTPLLPPIPAVDLICALPRPQTLKKVLVTCGMMGVRRLFLVRANRVEKSYFQSPVLQPENSRRYLMEGLSQGKLTRMPEVSVHDRFRAFFEDTLPAAVLGDHESESHAPIMLLPDVEASTTLAGCLANEAGFSEVAPVVVAIGPEGGWVPFEIELLERLGFRRFSLSRWVLRVETAVTAVLAQVELLRGRE